MSLIRDHPNMNIFNLGFNRLELIVIAIQILIPKVNFYMNINHLGLTIYFFHIIEIIIIYCSQSKIQNIDSNINSYSTININILFNLLLSLSSHLGIITLIISHLLLNINCINSLTSILDLSFQSPSVLGFLIDQT